MLEVVYLIFNEGYTAARGQDWLRPELSNEALRMGRVLTSIAPHEPEAHGLVAVGMAEGPEAGLAIVDRLVREPAPGCGVDPLVRGRYAWTCDRNTNLGPALGASM